MTQQQRDARNARRRAAYVVKVNQEEAQESPSGIAPSWREHGFQNARSVRRGLPDDLAYMAPFEEESDRWLASLNDEEDEALQRYRMFGYEYMNPLLRSEEDYQHFLTTNSLARGNTDHLRVRHQKECENLTRAMEKAQPVGNQPRQHYRFVELPEGNNSLEYIKQHYPVGQDVADKGFMSTSLDSDFMVKMGTDNNIDLDRSIVFEVLSASGAVMHTRRRRHNVMDDEKEILFPPGHQFEVVGVHEKVTFERDKEIRSMYNRPNKRIKVAVVQLVDKSILTNAVQEHPVVPDRDTSNQEEIEHV